MEVISGMHEKVEEASEGYRLSIESTLQLGFNIFRKTPAEFIILGVMGAIVFSNPLSGLLLGGPFAASFFHIAHLAKRDEPIGFHDFFKGFDKAGALIVLNLLILVVVLAGLLLLVLPGIYFAVSYLFSHLFVWFYDSEPPEAVKLSRKCVSGNFWQIVLLLLILAGINLLGVMAFGLGILLTLPFSFCVIYVAFDDIIGIKNQ
jgi:uncharacterized membrane protein